MDKKGNFIIISNIEWGFLKQRHQFLAEKLAEKGNNVIFVESSAKRNPTLNDLPRIFLRLEKLISRRINYGKQLNGYGQINPDITKVKVITPIVFPSTFKIFRFFNKVFFIKFLVKQIKNQIDHNHPIHIITYLPSSTSLQIISSFDARTVIYDCVSNFEAVIGMPRDTSKIEKYLVKNADVVLTDCDFLFEKHVSEAKRIKLLEPGVDFELFKELHVFSKNKKIKNICYYGLISDKIDFSLLDDLANNGLNLFMIGPMKKGIRLPTYINYIPAVKVDELPERLKEFDALIIPYIKNEFMKGVIPAKFFECLATGLPVIVTKLKNYERYNSFLITGDSNEEIVDAVKNFDLTKDRLNCAKERIKIAKKHSWDNFISEFFDEIKY